MLYTQVYIQTTYTNDEYAIYLKRKKEHSLLSIKSLASTTFTGIRNVKVSRLRAGFWDAIRSGYMTPFTIV